MTPASSHQLIRLFNMMLKRANAGKPGLTLKAYETSLDFDDREQVADAIARLAKSGHIRVDIGGERPGIMVMKDNWKATKPMQRGLVLPMAPFPVETPIQSAAKVEAEPVPYTDIITEMSTDKTALHHDPVKDTSLLSLKPSTAVWEYLFDELERTDRCVSAVSLCEAILDAHVRQQIESKVRIPARIITAAGRHGLPVLTYMVTLAEIGLTSLNVGEYPA